ncbi:MAG: hypothetical protein MZU97_01310 [Bacillus subtilis]|nr:hypothetical protein [Bacillus subtilis]
MPKKDIRQKLRTNRRHPGSTDWRSGCHHLKHPTISSIGVSGGLDSSARADRRLPRLRSAQARPQGNHRGHDAGDGHTESDARKDNARALMDALGCDVRGRFDLSDHVDRSSAN